MGTGKKKLLEVALSELKEVARVLGVPSFAGGQMVRWLYQRWVANIDEITDISKPNRERLAEEYEIDCMTHIDTQYSKDRTIKYLFPTALRKLVETMLILNDDRVTLCMSCQAGCKINYPFCQTGKQGFKGDPTYADISNQVYSLPECGRLTGIAFVGQDEPVDSLDNMLRVIQVMTTDYGYAWSPERITISSVNVKGKLKYFLDESDCCVAISSHSTLPKQRNMLIPAEGGMPIEQTAGLLRGYDFAYQRRLSFEYIVFGGLNDTPMYARRTIDLLHGLDCRVNLTHFHQTPNMPLKGADEQKMENLRNYLTSHGILTTIQVSRRQDIFAACDLLSAAREAGAWAGLIG